MKHLATCILLLLALLAPSRADSSGMWRAGIYQGAPRSFIDQQGRFRIPSSELIGNQATLGSVKGYGRGLVEAVDYRLQRLAQDASSYHQQAPSRRLSGQDAPLLPPWAYWVLAWVGGLLLVAVVAAEILRRRVNRKTAQLAARSREMQEGLSRLADIENALRASEEQYRTMVNNMEVGIYRTDGRDPGHFLQANPALARMLGFDSVNELMLEPVDSFFVDPASRQCLLRDLRSSGVVEGRDLLLRRRGGEQLWVRCTAVANHDGGGGLRWVDGVVIDNTERHRAEQALRESEERYRAVTDRSLTGVYIHRGGRFIYANQRLAEIMGCTVEDLLGMPFWELVHPQDRETVRRRGEARARGEMVDSSHYVFRAQTKDGQTRWLEIMAASIPLADGTANMGNVMDITDRLAAEQALAESEARYRQLVEQAPAGIYEIDLADYGFISVNDVMCELTGYSKEELLGMSPVDLLTESSRLLFAQRMGEVRSGRSIPETAEFEAVCKDGSTLWALVNTNFIFENQRPVRARVVAHNVTDRKLVGKALIESEERYRRLVEEVPYGLFICEVPSGRFLFVNQVLCDLFGYSQEEALALSVWEVTEAHDHQVLRERMAKRLRGDFSLGPSIYTGRHRDGRKIRYEVTAAHVQYQGRPALQGFLRDITEQERLERQLQHAQKMQAVGTLAGGVAHEFNNILMAIKGYTQLLSERATLDDSSRVWLQRIEASTDRAAELTGNMLSFSRLEHGKTSPMDLNQVVGEVADLLSRTLPPSIELNLELDPVMPSVVANPNHVEQVLLNLAVNARDAMPAGGHLVISTRLVAEGDQALRGQPWAGPGDYAEVSVSDTGAGIAPGHLERIFEPFFTTKEPGKGTGLGLSVAYSMIQNSGGQLAASSQAGSGSRFYFYLPAASGVPGWTPTLEVPAEPPAPGRGQRVLVVDDEDTVREVAREALAGYGYQVAEAAHGHEALEIFRDARDRGEPFDLVILDLFMPVMGGREAMRELLAIDPAARVVVATGHADTSDDLDGLEERVLGVLHKPFDLDRLVREVARALNRPDGH